MEEGEGSKGVVLVLASTLDGGTYLVLSSILHGYEDLCPGGMNEPPILPPIHTTSHIVAALVGDAESLPSRGEAFLRGVSFCPTRCVALPDALCRFA